MPASFGTSAQFSRELLDASLVQGMEIVQPSISPLITTVSLGNNQGNFAKYVVYGNQTKPRELFGKPIEGYDRIGSYAFSIRPVEYGGKVTMGDAEIADCTSPEWLEKSRQMGALVPQWLEERLCEDIVESATAFDGFDGQSLFSASHTWRTSDQTPGDPAPAGDTTPQSNLITAVSAGTDYTAASAVMDDFYDAVEKMNAFTDDKGNPFSTAGGKWFILYNNKKAALDRYLNAAFNPDSLPSDDSLRDGHRFQVTLIPTPFLASVASDSDFDWYLFRVVPGQKPSLVVQLRQGVESETWRDPATHLNHYQYTCRYGFGWTNWWNAIKVNKS